MNKKHDSDKIKAIEKIEYSEAMNEAHQDLNEFRATKKTINDLLNYRMSLMDIENSDFAKINEFKGKAIEAINHLFDDEQNTSPGQS